MRAFALIALCSLSVTLAAPQFGYGYQQQTHPSADISDFDSLQIGDKYSSTPSTGDEPLIRKQFYLVSAPEDGSNEPKQKHLVLGRPQKNYRVVFIKAPGPGNANIKYSAEFAPQDEKTVIYVLTKKEDELNASDIATPVPIEPSKPEVFFIKYKTTEEAEAAQREIQSEYDKLGGTSEYSDDKAPITSVVGALDGLTSDGSQQAVPDVSNHVNYSPQPTGVTPQSQRVQKSPISQYLPAITK